jgi:hypothetical protein
MYFGSEVSLLFRLLLIVIMYLSRPGLMLNQKKNLD